MEKSVNAGDLVEVFGKPLTHGEHEGWATVKEIASRRGNLVDCDVEFDDEPGEIYRRTIAIG